MTEDPCPECTQAALTSKVTTVKAQDLPPEVQARLRRADVLADEPRYRVGRKLGRTVYDHDYLIGMMDTIELGQRVADALNLIDEVSRTQHLEVLLRNKSL